ncbi:MAG: hypothetical protein R6U01_02130 [Halorubrum sp.]|uniref:hypothetical protein n=1 Tax=Halorubrum sp. TaxID=1879286 RepID=UPI0039706415
MPLRAHHVSPASIARRRPTQPVADVPFDDLVYLLAAGLIDAQTALDAHTAETAASLAETEVEVVPSVTRTIDADGGVTAEAAPPERRSLLELGIAPAWYRFSEATIEVDVDVSVTDRASDEDDRESGDEERASGLRADTRSVIGRRRFDRAADANARLAARLESTPRPVRAGPPADSEPAPGGDRAD